MTSTTPAFHVAPMSLADLDQVIAIERASFSAPWSRQAYRFEITQNASSTMLVARLQGNLPGQASRPRLESAPAPVVLAYGGFWLLVDEAHVATLAVHPDWRGLGLGEWVLLSLLQRGVELGALRATLEVRVSNLVAQNLYHKCGFEIVARNKRYYADNDEDAYIMATPSLQTPAVRAWLALRRTELYDRLAGLSEYPTGAGTKTQSG